MSPLAAWMDEVVARTVGSRARRAIAADARWTSAGLSRASVGIVEPEPVEPAGPEVLDQDVTRASSRRRTAAPSGASQVEPDASACSG